MAIWGGGGYWPFADIFGRSLLILIIFRVCVGGGGVGRGGSVEILGMFWVILRIGVGLFC